MARSSGPARALALVFVVATPVAACGQLTGLSDDYNYNLEAGSPTAAVVDSGNSTDARTPDASTADSSSDAADDARLQCSPADETRATAEMTAAAGDSVPLTCRRCLSTSCCTVIDTCSADPECLAAMKCIFGCQKDVGANKNQCLANCRPASFNTDVVPCVESHCTPPTCTLQ